MKIKEIGLRKTALNRFDLLGTDETALSKAFAFILGTEPSVLFKFIHFLGVKCKNTKSNYINTSVEIEKFRKEGRTDIEIRQPGKYHVIIESKIRKNKVTAQRTQYLSSFEKEKQKILCFITQEHDFQKQVDDDIVIHNLGWFDILNLFNSKEFISNQLINEFNNFSIRGFKMKDQKEILIQDLGKRNEIKKFRDYQIYRRNVTFGSPLYFSPYFTRNANQPEGEGISYLSKILGILTISPKDITNFKEDLHYFSDNNTDLVDKWINGVKLDYESKVDEKFTYFFLDEPLKLTVQLKKDGTNKKGRGKNWIAAMIPQNRCVTFDEFSKRLMEECLKQNKTPKTSNSSESQTAKHQAKLLKIF